MRIAFNATALLSPLTGIGQYAFELAQRLRADASLAPYFFYANGWSREVRSAPLPAARVVLPLIRRFLPNSYAISRHVQGEYFKHGVRQHKPDVYHEPNFLPFEFDGPTVTTVHDLSWIRHPEAHPKERVKAMNRYFEPCLRRSDLVLTDSEFVRQEVIEMFRGYRLDPKSEAVRIASDALRRTGHEPELVATGGGSDANALVASGYEAVLLANGTEANHTPEESVTEEAIVEMLKVCEAAIDEAAKVAVTTNGG